MNEPKEFKSIIGGNSLLIEPWPEAMPTAMLKLAIFNENQQLLATFSKGQAAEIADLINSILER